MKKCLFYTAFICTSFSKGYTQRILHGHVYAGQSNASPVDSVKLYTASGNAAFTDVQGSYAISIKEVADTLYVQYKDRQPVHFTITEKGTPDKFDIYLNNPDFFKNEPVHILKDVEVRTRNYHQDSLETRGKYNGIFTYEKPKFRYGKEWIITPLGGGMDIVALMRVLQFQKKRKQLGYKKFALQSEEQLYIDSRFTKGLAGRITHIDDNDELFRFMEWCRPAPPQLRLMNDLELNQYIADNYKEYLKCKVNKN